MTWANSMPPPVDVSFEPQIAPPWLVHVRAGGLYGQTVNSEQPIRIQDPGQAGTIRSFAAAMGKDNSIVAWIEQEGEGNRLMVRALLPEGPSQAWTQLASGIASTNVRIVTDPDGRIYILDASLGEEGDVHITAWDGPENKVERVALDTSGMPSISPFTAVIIKEGLHLFMVSTVDERVDVIDLVYQLDTFERESRTRAAEADRVIFLKSIVIGQEPALMYKDQRGGVLGLSFAIKGVSGWSSLPITGVQGLDVARTAEGAWVDGALLVALSAEDKGSYKQRIFAAKSRDKGQTWDFGRIDTPEGTSTRAWLPDLTVDGDLVGLVWEDYRDIRPSVRMQLSRDRGATWLARDIEVSDRRHPALRPRVMAHAGNLYIAWYQYRTDARKEADAMLIRMDWDEAFARAMGAEKPDNPEEKERLLKEAVADYWNAMLKGNLERAYQLHDPFFRARIPFDAFATQRGKFIYHSHQIQSLLIDGNVARVQSTTSFEIPKLLVMGREQAVPRRDFAIDDTWLYVDGGWYRQYVDAVSGGSAIPY